MLKISGTVPEATVAIKRRHCRAAASPEDAAIPWNAFPVGGVTAGAVHAHEEFGVTVDLLADENVVGLISPGQVRSKLHCQLQ
jgi:hypothetical protein